LYHSIFVRIALKLDIRAKVHQDLGNINIFQADG